ncbi:MAG: histidinol-phosphatase, partial [Burkholderiales bacterium]|nr:histidinol-phosphatase [Anaerolineae bacterium]
FDELSKRARIYRSWGDCHGYFSVATGFADVTMDAVMNPWDIMAVVPIIEGAGGRITDWQGGDAVTGTSTVASAGPLHDEIIRALNR